jgi:hypothetical protein
MVKKCSVLWDVTQCGSVKDVVCSYQAVRWYVPQDTELQLSCLLFLLLSFADKT